MFFKYNVMRIIILILLLPYCQLINGQIDYNFVIGGRIHTSLNDFVNADVGWWLLNSPVIGLEIGNENSRLSLSYQYDINFAATETFTFNDLKEEHNVNLYYKIKVGSIGLGHYWKKIEDYGNYLFPGLLVDKFNGVQACYYIPVDKFRFEYRFKVLYSPDFALLGLERHNVYILYPIKDEARKGEEISKNDRLNLRILAGVRSSILPNINLLPGENDARIGVFPTLGMEAYFTKLRFSINYERDWWVGLNFGSPVRTVRGTINTTQLGGRYHFKLPNEKFLRTGVNFSFVSDTYIRKNIDFNIDKNKRFYHYQVKGIGFTLSYEFLNNLDLELRQILPLSRIAQPEDNRLFSIGLMYRTL